MVITQRSMDKLTDKSFKSVFSEDKPVQVVVQKKSTFNKQYFDAARSGKKIAESNGKKLSGRAKELYTIMVRGK
jgi:hypothetical protein